MATVDETELALKVLEKVRSIVKADRDARVKCALLDDEPGGCACSYKDCYECGKWHDCTHNGLSVLSELIRE